MSQKSIDDIFAANDAIRAEYREEIEAISPEDAAVRLSDDQWSINEIVEHTAIVFSAVVKICRRLLAAAEAEAAAGDGFAKFSEGFVTSSAAAARTPLKAPDPVRPSGTLSIGQSLATMESDRLELETLRGNFKRFDASRHTFPHPAFGDMNAYDWLALAGGHEKRHLAQIRRILSQIKNQHTAG